MLIRCAASSPAQLHARLLKSALIAEPRQATTLLSGYANALHFAEADSVLASLPNPDLFSFSTLIHAFAKLGRLAGALSLFSRMIADRILPDRFLFPSVAKACSGLKSPDIGKQVHAFALALGFSSDPFVQSSLLHMYLKCNRVSDARKLFDIMPQRDFVCWSALIAGYSGLGLLNEATELFREMRKTGLEPNAVSWNGMISGFNQNGFFNEAIDMFREMNSEGFSPDSCSISSVLPAFGVLGDLGAGIQTHCYAVKKGYESDKCVVSALIDMYGKCSCREEMCRVFHGMELTDVAALNAFLTGLSRNGFVYDALNVFNKFKRQKVMELNAVTWTSVIASCSQNGKDMEALELFREMQIEGMKPNFVTIPCLLPACGNIAALMHGKAAHCFSLRMGFFDDVYVGSALIDMYANCGKILSSRLFFDRMPKRNLVCWNAMMNGYAMHGKAKETVEIFHSMRKSGMKPDLISFTCVLSALSQNGLIDEGWRFFNSMSNEHNMKPRLEHYGCMVTLLSRAGKLREAYSMITEMPFEADGSIWGSLLSSCRLYNDAGLGAKAAGKLFELEPQNPGNYVILSNIYASKKMWSDVNRVRDKMHRKGLRKNPGCSWIEVKNQVHMLLAGDKSHPQRDLIVRKLEKLGSEMKKSGFSPDTGFVLQDVEEHDKEEILCGHSEKLAIALGLLNTGPRLSLTVIKNLRICGDCHIFMKFVSGFEDREIFVRDTVRFHHFKDGECSCRDYW